jgi:hypothetical protein
VNGCPRCLNGGSCQGSLFFKCKCPKGWAGADCSRKTCVSDNDCDPSSIKQALRPFSQVPSIFRYSGPQT